jgi:hypothetical protein
MTVALVAGLLAGSWYVSRRRRLSR